ncbi:MAG: AAA family ATPase [Haloarculaceae archaeon]
MDAPLWTETHAPALGDLPQPAVRDYLEGAVDDPINLVLYGPVGCGKTAAARALANAAHEDPDNDFVEINVADFFQRTKSEIRDDPRFRPFLTGRSAMSKRDMINHVLKESASYAPVSGTFKTVLLDNAEAIREDFQQALRRVMEQYHQTTQFVIATRQPSKLIPPIESRCFSVPMRAPSIEETATELERIVAAEGVDYDEDGLEYVAGYGGGNLRKAVLGAQATAEDGGEVTMAAAHEALGSVGDDDQVESMVAAAERGEFGDARGTLDDLLFDEGVSGEEVLSDVLRVARSRYSGDDLARVYELAGQVDLDLVEGTSDRTHLARLLAELGQ